MNEVKHHFNKSLDISDQSIEPFIPYLLKDLTELGSMPSYIQRLLEMHVEQRLINTVVDLGCGKGSVLISLSKSFPFQGTGIDLVADFIAEAKELASSHGGAATLEFIQGDLSEHIRQLRNIDLLIYGYDSGILGDVSETLRKLAPCISKGRYIILETSHTHEGTDKIEDVPSERELKRMITDSNLHVVDCIVWDRAELREMNNKANTAISRRVNELITAYPHKSKMFLSYLENQFDECRQLENELSCMTWLLRNNP